MITNEQKLKYINLWSHKNERSTVGLALSEFIDNSISAYLRINDGNINGCKIVFIIDESDDDNHKLIIEDNASGMDDQILNGAVEQYKNAGYIDDSGLNQYGLGMKFGIFYLGKNAKVWTKEINGTEYFVDYEASNKEPDDTVITVINSSKDSKITRSGTIILIEDLYKRKFVKKTNDYTEFRLDENIEDTVTFRFKNYIQKGLIIRFVYKNNKGSELEILNLTSNSKFRDYFDNLSFKLTTFIKEVHKTSDREFDDFKNKCQDYLREIRNNIKKEDLEWGTLYINIIDKMISNESVVLKEMIKFNGEELPVTLTILNKSNAKQSGVAILHQGRYIRHLPNKKIDNINFGLQTFTARRYKDDKHKWLYAEVDLTDTKKYNIKPDKNKYDFLWTEESITSWNNAFEALIDKYIYFIINVLINLENYVISLKTKKINDNTNKDVRKLNKPFFESSVDSDTTIYNISNEPGSPEYFKIDGQVKFIIECDRNLPIAFDFCETSIIEGEKIYKFSYNSVFEKNITEMRSPKLTMIRALCILYYILELSGKTYDNILDIFKKISSEKNEI